MQTMQYYLAIARFYLIYDDLSITLINAQIEARIAIISGYYCSLYFQG